VEHLASDEGLEPLSREFFHQQLEQQVATARVLKLRAWLDPHGDGRGRAAAGCPRRGQRLLQCWKGLVSSIVPEAKAIGQSGRVTEKSPRGDITRIERG
jgi:hypothetical protein